jgi:CDP-diacylglycerol--serine O-phosphatidyltransferase
MPVPAAAMTSASCSYLFPEKIGDKTLSGALSALIIIITILMISRVRYRSFKDIDLKSRKSYVYIFFFAFALVAIAVEPKYAIFGLALAYLFSGLIPLLLAYLRRVFSIPTRGADRHGESQEEGKLAER